jgi:selenide, water dikinase
MAALNRRASEIMVRVGISTATDITGFGLIGHLYEVLSASNLRAHIYSNRVPFFVEAVRLAEMKKVPGGSIANLKNLEPYVTWPGAISDTEKFLLHDAQTSGGLLVFVPGENKDRLVSTLQKEGIPSAHIGDVFSGSMKDNKRIFVTDAAGLLPAYFPRTLAASSAK